MVPMPHIVFIHGILNKPEQERLRQDWLRALRDSGLDLGAEGVETNMVYWADVFYAEPQSSIARKEAAVSVADIDEVPPHAPRNIEEAAFIAELTTKLEAELGAEEIEEAASGSVEGLERIPLPGPVKKWALKRLVRDTHHYLFNIEVEPRAGERYQARDEIRRRFVETLAAVPFDDPVIVVSHSMGTVIAYDCLVNVEACRRISGFVTMGSPLGIDEIQDGLSPGYSRRNGFPMKTPHWTNIYDPLDLICAPDPELSNDFERSGVAAVSDVCVTNAGSWRHDVDEYLRRSQTHSALREMLSL